jgi:CRP/FNR family transcriptional regulator
MMGSRATKEELELLENVPLFAQTGKKQLRTIAQQCPIRNILEGEHLAEQGERGREFFVIVSGSARCEVDGREVSRFHHGSFFGELALIADAQRSATIIAESPMEVLVLDRSDFTPLLRAAPDVTIKILRAVAARLQEVDRRLTD